MIRPWKVVAQHLAKRRAAKARAALAEELFIEAAKRLIQEHDDDWYWSRPSRRRHRSTAQIIAEQVLNRRGVSPGDQDGQAQEPAPRSG